MRGDRYREGKGRRDLEEWVCGQSCCEHCRCSKVNHYGFPITLICFHYMQSRALSQYHNSWVELTQQRKGRAGGGYCGGGGRCQECYEERTSCENTWKQESHGRYMAEFPDPAVLWWSVHSCLLRDSRRGSYLLCVLMGQIYKRIHCSQRNSHSSGRKVEYKYLWNDILRYICELRMQATSR